MSLSFSRWSQAAVLTAALGFAATVQAQKVKLEPARRIVIE